MKSNKTPLKLPILFSVVSFVLTVLSFLLVSESAGKEPFLRFQASHAWTQLVGATVVIVVWIELIGGIVYSFMKKGFNFKLLVLLVWSVFVLFWLVQVPFSYVSDIVKSQNL